MNENARMIAKIDRHIRAVPDESRRVLTYIKQELAAVERRAAADAGGEDHLIAVANAHLRHFEPKEDS